MPPSDAYHPTPRFTYIVLALDQTVPAYSWRFRFDRGSFEAARIALLEGALLMQQLPRDRLRVVKYLWPIAKTAPVHVLEIFDNPAFGKRVPAIVKLLAEARAALGATDIPPDAYLGRSRAREAPA